MDKKEFIVNVLCFIFMICVCCYLISLTYEHVVVANVTRENNATLTIENE